MGRHEPVAYELREATEVDHEFLWELHALAMRAPVERTWGWDEGFQRGYFDKHFDPAKRRIVVVDGQDAGVLQTERREDSPFLANVEILPPFQGQGLGTKIVEDVLAEARYKLRALGFSFRTCNVTGSPCAERLGFVVVGETETSHLMSTADASVLSPHN